MIRDTRGLLHVPLRLEADLGRRLSRGPADDCSASPFKAEFDDRSLATCFLLRNCNLSGSLFSVRTACSHGPSA
jgi:hypothetical protein